MKDDIASTETKTFAKLSAIKDTLIALKTIPERADCKQMADRYAGQLKALAAQHSERKSQRDHQRVHYRKTLTGTALNVALEAIRRESQQDGMERRRFKQKRDEAIAPIVKAIAQADQQMQELKQDYTSLSKAWQTRIQAAYLEQQSNQRTNNLPIVYQDNYLIVVNKPAGLLSVPGRRHNLQDSVLNRLRAQAPKGSFLQAVHRLDQATSGLMMLATCANAHSEMSQQFAKRQVHKRYEAILSQPIKKTKGSIELSLQNNPESHPKQEVDSQRGKPSRTDFRILTTDSFSRERPCYCPRVEFIPCTGRTHQIRLHTAHPKGLNSPIVGDTIYGTASSQKRLMLHATVLRFVHPVTKKSLHLSSTASFET